VQDTSTWLAEARRVLDEEAAAITDVASRLDEASLTTAVSLIVNCTGRICVTGMGKSGAIGRKLASTLASTGSPAFFLHPAEALHGDLGMITDADVVVAFSYSGETDELLAILPAIDRLGVPIVSFTGRPQSTLGTTGAVVLNCAVEREACILNLAPTTSTTVMLALSDALAITVMHARQFTADQYASRHPAGSLGRRLLLRVVDVMRTGDALAVVPETTLLRETLFAITKANAGAAIVVDSSGKVSGFVTDGDVRRHLLDSADCLMRPVTETMNPNPGLIPNSILAVEGLEMLGSFHPIPGARAGEAPVVDEDGKPVGMLMLKDLVKAGIV
jgi:arabinose-5-phosphate isomerase